MDPRAARTLQKIVDAVHDLARSGARAITVADVIRRAGVGKTSFYSHFSGIGELALHVFLESFQAPDSTEPAEQVGPDGAGDLAEPLTLAAVVAHYAENRGLYETVLSVPQSADIMNTAIRILADRLETREDHVAADDPDRVRHMITAAAILGALNAWVRGEVPATADQLATTLDVLVTSPIPR
jgi:AcrR family transcriptional regulator